MKYIALGTTASLPTAERGCPAGLLVTDSDRALLDCGDGTTRQMSILKESLQRVSLVWLSHCHIDHLSGLAGFLWCLDLVSPPATVPLFGNAQAIRAAEALLRPCELRSVRPEVHVIGDGIFHETNRIVWRSFSLSHTVPTLGLVVEKKPFRRFSAGRADALGIPAGPIRQELASGKAVILPGGRRVEPDDVCGPAVRTSKLVYVADTEFFGGLVEACRKADLLICEATYHSRDAELARKYKHMTARDAATLAVQADVARLVLTHVSPRVESSDLEADARAVFPATEVANDLSFYEIPDALGSSHSG